MVTDRSVALLRQYKIAEQLLAPLKDCEGDLQILDSEVLVLAAELSQNRRTLDKKHKHNAHLRRRIHRNENPRFFHYFVFNRSAKVERLKSELKQRVLEEDTLFGKITMESMKLANLKQQQENAHIALDEKSELESRRRNLFDQVVDAEPPTQALQQLRAKLLEQRSRLATEQRLLAAVASSSSQVTQGLSSFHDADLLYRKALAASDDRLRQSGAYGGSVAGAAATDRRELLEQFEAADVADAGGSALAERPGWQRADRLGSSRSIGAVAIGSVAMAAYAERNGSARSMGSISTAACTERTGSCRSVGSVGTAALADRSLRPERSVVSEKRAPPEQQRPQIRSPAKWLLAAPEAERDAIVSLAHKEVIRAYSTVSAAFAAFPAEARMRYPELCNAFGQVAYPRVQGANLASACVSDAFFGSASPGNNRSFSCTIQHNLRVVDECIALTSQQLSLACTVDSAINVTLQQLRSTLVSLEDGIEKERGHIFRRVREAMSI
eukprot:TRINITY_DN11347_c0_g2_i1.p1 TRINITY_DN11347_c0_g2~~TRINITY_DN11347_c0_g2_i1.p1  ORF type:complete len:518 (+),score=112.53 TRINITY_DN11347_c0_g2_i1:62-1555(+)